MSERQLQHIFLDMDGVITDFVAAVLKLHGQSHMLAEWPAGERDIPKVLKISRTGYWNVIDSQGSDFWASLEPFPWFSELVGLVRQFGPLSILTAPSLSPASSEGKIRWLYEYFPKEKGKRVTDFLISQRKHLLAAPGRVLIDDSEEHVDKFRQAGGHAILFPQIWNSNHAVGDRLQYVKAELQKILDGT